MGKKLLALLLTVGMAFCSVDNAAIVFAADEEENIEATGVNSYTSVAGAAAYVKRQMLRRRETITFRYEVSGLDNGKLSNLQEQLLSEVCAVTNKPQEGDYLSYHIKRVDQQAIYTGKGADITWQVQYSSDAMQEEMVADEIQNVVKSLKLSKCTDAEKVKRIYDYICKNVTYYDDGTWDCHSAYNALEGHSAVCQGYATLFYALGLEAGLKVRCIKGTGNGMAHLWNIVCLDGKWYNLDVTWDDGGKSAGNKYFLKCDKEFSNHTKDGEYTTASFMKDYPMSRKSYSKAAAVPDLAGVTVTGKDKVKLTWDMVSSAYGYQIYAATSKNGTYKKLKTVTGGKVTATTVSGLTPGKTYYFKVRAYSKLFGNRTSGFSDLKSVKLVPKKVVLSAVSASDKSLKVKWKTQKNVDGYEILISYRNGNKTVTNRTSVTASAKAVQSKTIRGLATGKNCSVKVRAYVKSTNGRIYGSYSSVIKRMVK